MIVLRFFFQKKKPALCILKNKEQMVSLKRYIVFAVTPSPGLKLWFFRYIAVLKKYMSPAKRNIISWLKRRFASTKCVDIS